MMKVFFRQKTRFSAKKIEAAFRDGGKVPPFSVIFFPLTFWPAAFRDGGRGGGGAPPSRTFSVTGVLEPFPKYETYCDLYP